MTSDQKKKVEKAMAEDKKRFDKQVKEFDEKGYYITESGEKSNMIKLKRGVDGAPKDVIDQYKAFSKLYLDTIKSKLSEEELKTGASVKAKVKEAFDKITKEQESEVAKYILKDKKRYEKERTEFNEKGYYTMADGTRSIDQVKKETKKKAETDDEAKDSKKKPAMKKMGKRC